MKYFVLVLLSLKTAVFCAMVRELPFLFNSSEIEESVINVEDVTAVTTLFSEVFEQLIHLEDETNETIPEINSNWSSEGQPILSALLNFWDHAKTGFIDMKDKASEEAINSNAEHVIKAIEYGLIEATTMLRSRIEETTLAPLPSFEKDEDIASESTVFTKRQGEETSKHLLNTELNKRQTAFNLIENITSSCSNCYDKLQTCVQRCFADNNCNNVQRSALICPSVPNRLCNFFTQWSPVDECISHSDCKSPFLCCNDGCGNKCVSGVWNS